MFHSERVFFTSHVIASPDVSSIYRQFKVTVDMDREVGPHGEGKEAECVTREGQGGDTILREVRSNAHTGEELHAPTLRVAGHVAAPATPRAT